MLKIPQIITSNLNPKIVDAVFRLLNEIKDSQIKDEKMCDFYVKLTDNDGRSKDFDKRTQGTIDLNDSYSQLSLIQQRIVKRTFEIVIMEPDTYSIMDKYLYEMEMIISKEIKNINMNKGTIQ